MTVTLWPHRSLAAVPGEHIAIRLADEVRRLSFDETSPCDLDRLCTLGSFKYQLAVLDTGCRGHEALLVPRVEGGFDILVDPVPTRGRAVHDEVARARLSLGRGSSPSALRLGSRLGRHAVRDAGAVRAFVCREFVLPRAAGRAADRLERGPAAAVVLLRGGQHGGQWT